MFSIQVQRVVIDGVRCFDQQAAVGVGTLDRDGMIGGVDLVFEVADAFCI